MSVGARDTINIDESVHEIYKQLTEGNDPVNAPFKTMKDVFLWAACLGFKAGSRKALDGKKVTIFRWAQFNQQIDLPLIKSLILSDTSSLDILDKQDDLIEIIEEFANSGALELKNMLADNSMNTLWHFVERIK